MAAQAFSSAAAVCNAVSAAWLRWPANHSGTGARRLQRLKPDGRRGRQSRRAARPAEPQGIKLLPRAASVGPVGMIGQEPLDHSRIARRRRQPPGDGAGGRLQACRQRIGLCTFRPRRKASQERSNRRQRPRRLGHRPGFRLQRRQPRCRQQCETPCRKHGQESLQIRPDRSMASRTPSAQTARPYRSRPARARSDGDLAKRAGLGSRDGRTPFSSSARKMRSGSVTTSVCWPRKPKGMALNGKSARRVAISFLEARASSASSITNYEATDFWDQMTIAVWAFISSARIDRENSRRRRDRSPTRRRSRDRRGISPNWRGHRDPFAKGI